MKLELDDFSPVEKIQKDMIQTQQKIEEEEDKEKKEEYYKEELQKLEQKYKSLVEEVSKEYYEKGARETQEKLEGEYQKKIQEIVLEYEKRLEENQKKEQQKIYDLELKLSKKYDQYITQLTKILLDNINEILEFLYIDKQNTPFITQIIAKLLEDFHQFIPLNITVAENMVDEMRKFFHKIEIKGSSELQNNEFIIDFNKFKVENRIKEKLKIIEDEIKREIKKLT